MGLLDNALFGTPPNHDQDKQDTAVAPVQAPEFDVTQYVKKLAIVIGVLAPALIAALKLFNVKEVTPGIVIGALAVTAVALLSVSLIMAVDLASRAYLTRGEASTDGHHGVDHTSQPGLIAAEPGTLVWLEGDDEPRSVLAIAGDGTGASSYLAVSGPALERPFGDRRVVVFDGAPTWHSADKTKAYRLPNWD
jgi:hypothetical protein